MEGNDRDSIIKPIFGLSLGTYLEFLDFALYASLAPLFAIKFFPSEYHDVSIIYSWGIFGVSFLVRPFAGFIMGPIGDKIGIKRIMLFSLALMGGATAAIGLLPTYESIGLFSPILLIGLRMTQGFALSIEYGALSTYLSHIGSIKNKFGLYSSFTSVAVLSGMISGSILIGLLLNNQTILDIPDWQWRAPFIVCGILVGVFGFYLRLQLKNICFLNTRVDNNPISNLLKNHSHILLLVILITGFISISSYVVLSYLPNYLQIVRHLYIKESLLLCNLFGLPMLCVVPLGGWISDKIGRVKVIKIFSLSMTLISISSIAMLAYGNLFCIGIGILILSLNIGILAGCIPALITETFNVRHRYTGITIAYNSAASWLGGTAPMIISFLMSKTNNVLTPGLYMSFFATLSYVSSLWLNKLAAENKITIRNMVLKNV